MIPEIHQGRRVVSAAEMREIDRRAILQFGIPALELMERAGRGVAAAARDFLSRRLGAQPGKVGVCCGRGNNGGDGLVAARLLRQMGALAAAWIVPPKGGYGPEVRANLDLARKAGVDVAVLAENETPGLKALRSQDLLIDALLGTGSSGAPAGIVRRIIEKMLGAKRPILSVDIPSGLDPDTGEPGAACIAAAVTATLGLPKRGLLTAHARGSVGELKIVDLGLPRELTQPEGIHEKDQPVGPGRLGLRRGDSLSKEIHGHGA